MRLGTVLGLALVLAACSPSDPGSSSPDSSATASTAGPIVESAVTAEYLPGLAATVRVPEGLGAAPLVVLVPGGGWSSADPSGLVPLAERLTASGATTSLVTYSTTSTGAVFPQPADDVACAVRWSAQEATTLGHPPSIVAVVGHSAGGHLATLVALSGNEFGRGCSAPPVTLDGVVGLAGVYDVNWDVSALDALFAGDDTPDGRAKGSPLQWARSGPPSGLEVLLVHGDADDQVPLEQSTVLADALVDSGVDVKIDVLPGEDHMTVIDKDVAGPLIQQWLADLA